jgi:uncharacterized membrane protein
VIVEEQGIVEEEQAAEPERQRRSIIRDFRETPRAQQIILAGLVFWILLSSVVHFFTWVTHKAPLRPEMVAASMLVLLGLMVWHSWLVKGPRQTVTFFLIAIPISWFCEFIGHNYGWFFGHYKYTNTLTPRIGGVPVLIIITWSAIIYTSYMLVDWLAGLQGEKQGRSWWGKTLWALIVAASSATLVCAWDMMVDPFATSKVWMTAGNKEPWWWWESGPYLRNLQVWKGEGGVPIGNFVGWWLAPFFIVFIFYLFFQKKDVISDRLINVAPLLAYFWIFWTVVVVVLEMNWFENGMTQVALIGFFTMMPVTLVGVVKLAKEYT